MRYDIPAYTLMVSAIAFMGIAVLFIYIERYIQSLLSFITGMVLLSSALAILRERMQCKENQ